MYILYVKQSPHWNQDSKYKNLLRNTTVTIGLWAPLDLGGGGAVTLLPEKITQCPKACVVQMHSNRSKNKNAPNFYV